MVVICPTVTAENPHNYRAQIEKVAHIGRRIHLDFSDGEFAPRHLMNLAQAWWPVGLQADVHLMVKRPGDAMHQLLNLMPHLVVFHAEAEGNFFDMAHRLKSAGIKVGLALLQDTQPSLIRSAMSEVDHILIFSGDLGNFGGTANLGLLEKIAQIKGRRPDIEIGWDGGINDHNAAQLVQGGVDILNVGGYIQHADNPKNAYDTLIRVTQERNANVKDI